MPNGPDLQRNLAPVKVYIPPFANRQQGDRELRAVNLCDDEGEVRGPTLAGQFDSHA
jgi:hypothetical protein